MSEPPVDATTLALVPDPLTVMFASVAFWKSPSVVCEPPATVWVATLAAPAVIDAVMTSSASVIATAAGSGSAVEITQVALGDGGGALYTPDGSETALAGEQARVDIDTRYQLATKDWRTHAVFPASTPSFTVREAGAFNGAGELIFLTAFEAGEEHQAGGYEYLLDYVLSFETTADGVVVVTAPDDVIFGQAVVTGAAIAQLQLEQLRQRDAIRRATGTY